MGGFGYLIGKGLLIVATAAQLTTGVILCANPVTAPAGVMFISGAEASAAMLASPIDPVSATIAIATGPA